MLHLTDLSEGADHRSAPSSVGHAVHGLDERRVVRRDVRRLGLQLGLPGGQLAHRQARVHQDNHHWGPLPGLQGRKIAAFLCGGGARTRERGAAVFHFV